MDHLGLWDSFTMSTKSRIASAYMDLTTHNILYQNKWICDEVLFRHIPSICPQLALDTTINRRVVIAAVLSKVYPFNSNGVYHVDFKMECPLDTTSNWRTVHFFYRETNGIPPRKPTSAKEIYWPMSSREIQIQLLLRNTTQLEPGMIHWWTTHYQ